MRFGSCFCFMSTIVDGFERSFGGYVTFGFIYVVIGAVLYKIVAVFSVGLCIAGFYIVVFKGSFLKLRLFRSL